MKTNQHAARTEAVAAQSPSINFGVFALSLGGCFLQVNELGENTLTFSSHFGIGNRTTRLRQT